MMTDIEVTDIDTVHQRLDQARDHLAAAERVLTARAPAAAELHAAVDGAMRVCSALADLVATVMRQAPTTLDHSSGPILNELLADLRATHGCLITGPLLLAPARDDLHQLVTSQHAGPAILDNAAPAPDVADQRRPARPKPADGEQALHALHGIEDMLEADPADVAHRVAPVLDPSEP